MQSGLKVQLAASALSSIRSAILAGDSRLETGGALFGPRDGSAVLHALGPGPMAEHGARFFRRDIAFTQREADQVYRADGSQWIGEWHTHIDVPPSPSDLDLHTYLTHFADPDLNFNRFIAIVVAPSAPEPSLAVWLLERQQHSITLTWAGEQPFGPH